MEVYSEQAAGRQAHIDNEKSGPDIAKSERIDTNAEVAWDDAFLVTFAPDDVENPLNWSKKLKWGVTAAVSSTGFVRIIVSTVRTRA